MSPRSASAGALIARKEAAELLASPRGIAWMILLSVVLSGFALLLIGSSELSLLENAQVVYDMMAIAAGLAAMLALIAGVDAVAGERERGTLVPLLLAPVSPGALVAGKLGGLLFATVALYVLTLPYLWAVGSTGQNLGAAALTLALFGAPLVFAFGLFGLGLGARGGSLRGALLGGLVVMIFSASPIIIGPGLRQSAIGQAFDVVNPFSAAVNAFDAIVIDSLSVTSQLQQLGVELVWLALAAWFAYAGLRAVAEGRRR